MRVQFTGNNGFSLMELIVTLGIMGAVMVGMTTLFVNQSKQIKRLETKSLAIGLNSEIQAGLMSSGVCSDMLSGQNFNVTQARAIWTENNQVAGAPISITLPGGRVFDGNNPGEIDGYPLELSRLSLVNLTDFSTSGGNTIRRASVQFATAGILGSSTIGFAPRIIGSVYIEQNAAGNIVNCLGPGLNGQSNDDFLNVVCISFGGNYSGGNCSLPAPGASPAMLRDVCSSLGGTFSGGGCQLPSQDDTYVCGSRLCSQNEYIVYMDEQSRAGN